MEKTTSEKNVADIGKALENHKKGSIFPIKPHSKANVMARFFYHNHISGFLADTNDAILGALARNNAFDLTELQRNAWLFEFSCLKQILQDKSEGQIIFEYSIPHLGKRIDAVLLLHGIVFVLEFKLSYWCC